MRTEREPIHPTLSLVSPRRIHDAKPSLMACTCAIVMNQCSFRWRSTCTAADSTSDYASILMKVYGTYMDPPLLQGNFIAINRSGCRHIFDLYWSLDAPGPDGFCPLSTSTAVRLH